MQTARHDIIPPLLIRIIIPPRLQDVNLARLRPLAVRIVRRQQHDGGPQPVAGRQARGDLDATVLDGRAAARVDATGAHGRDDSAVGGVGGGNAVVEEAAGAVGVAEVEEGVVEDEGGVLEGGFEDEDGVGDEDVFVCGGGLGEGAYAWRS